MFDLSTLRGSRAAGRAPERRTAAMGATRHGRRRPDRSTPWREGAAAAVMAIGLMLGTSSAEEYICTCKDWTSCGGTRAPDNVLDYRACPSTGGCANDDIQECSADQKPVPKNFVGGTIQIVSKLESTIQIPVIVSLKAHTATIYLNSRQPGVLLRNNGTCYDNAKRGGVKECPYVLQWKSGCGSTGGGSPSSEDIQKYECLDAVAPISGQLNCEYSLCRLLCATPSLEITPYYLPDFERLIVGAPDVEFGVCSLINGQFPDSCFKLVRLLHVGEELRFELNARSAISSDQVDIQAAVEPGVPIGMDFADSSLAPGQGTKTRAVVWTPRPGQQGKMHIASFLSLILPEETRGVSCPLYFRRMHIQIQVQAYQSFWQIPSMTGLSDHKILVSKPNGIVNAGRFGPDILLSVSSGQQIEGVELRCYSDVATQFSYNPSITLHNVSVDGKLIEGHCDKSSCSSPSKLAGWGGFGDMTQIRFYPGNELSFEFKYKSVIRLDEGSEKRWCFSCTDSGAMNAPAIQCITVRTRLCELYIQNGDTLEGITRKYHLVHVSKDRNWRRLWNLNSQLVNPYQILHGDQTLRYGPLYTVRVGDTLVTIAAHFETTLKKLLSVNPQIVQEDEILPGEDICVLPCTNRNPPSHFENPDYHQ